MPPAGSTQPNVSFEPLQQEKKQGMMNGSKKKPHFDKNKQIPHIPEEEFEEAPMSTALVAYCNLLLLACFGYFRDFLRSIGIEKSVNSAEFENEGFSPLYHEFESFYHRNVYHRGSALIAAPLAGVPGAEIDIIDRNWGDHLASFTLAETTKKYINVGSYNYLGFAENDGMCSKQAIEEIRRTGGGIASTRCEIGTLAIHKELETLVAKLVGKEEAIVFGMGFATNSLNIPSLVDEGCLLISDALNHSSLILGARLCGAKIRTFKHNDTKDLEKILIKSIVEGQPRTHRPWRKILIVVEGLYSMEGTMCNLPAIVAIKQKYKAYLYVDEAHSIGALGANGKGVCEHHGVNPDDIDILMGTFSKSFGAAGGYICGNKEIVAHLRRESHAQSYSTPMSPPVARQILASMHAIMGTDGTNDGQKRIKQLADNTSYFRSELKKRGYIVYGDPASPVVPLLLFTLAKICAFARLCLDRGLATVIVAFPATSMLGARARFCISASHTREHMDRVLDILEELDPVIGLKLSKTRPTSPTWDFIKNVFGY